MRIADYYERVAWLNPDPQSDWKLTHTTRVIEQIFPMFPLNLDRIQDAVTALVGGRRSSPVGQTRHEKRAR